MSERNSHWLRGYQRTWLGPDVIAGLTAAAVVLPMAMAYAAIAGLPLQVGLYTALVPMVAYALIGSSRALSVSTSSTLAILTGTALTELAPEIDHGAIMAALSMLTLLVGAMLVLASLLRCGFIANFISHPVLVGFKAGIGLVIAVDQIPKLLGIQFHKGSFLHNLLAIVEGLPNSSAMTVTLGLVTIGILLVVERVLPRGPAPLLAVAAGIASMGLLGLQSHGVQTVGRIPEGFPSLSWPNVALLDQLWPAALGIALMSFTETIAAGRAFVGPGDPLLHPNRELLATGIANVAGAVLGAMPAGGGTSQTAVNRFAGAKSQLSTLVTAGVTLVTMFALAPLVELLPQATLAAIVLVYAAKLIDPLEFGAIASIRWREFAWIIVAVAGVVLFGTLKGILVAVAVSLLALAYDVANPPVYVLGRKPGTNVFRPRSNEHPEDETIPGLLLVQLEGPIFFVNAELIADKMRPLIASSQPKVVALDLSGVSDLEYTALKMLTEAEKRNRDHGLALWLVGLQPMVLATVQRSPLGKTLGRERMFFNLEQAVARYKAMTGTVTARAD
ncbi:MAG TPA: SulP family inorganic anion transporter [Bradyrhizobium sp.]|nr:SulP family inorganic anion transporter [Bradyrhizobium sp.]